MRITRVMEELHGDRRFSEVVTERHTFLQSYFLCLLKADTISLAAAHIILSLKLGTARTATAPPPSPGITAAAPTAATPVPAAAPAAEAPAGTPNPKPNAPNGYAYGWYNSPPLDLKDHRSKLGRGKGVTHSTGSGQANLDENKIYFDHGDHLGSASYVTDVLGDVYEHMLYLPYGETWVDEGSNTHLLGFRFTGKEEDAETKLIYFGARYYDARVSGWISTDPILDKYLPTGSQLFFPDKAFEASKLSGMGGIYNSKNLGMYSYAHLNPVTFQDPDGNEVKLNLLHPTRGIGKVTDAFGPRGSFHYGTDFVAPRGTPIVAMAPGTVKGVAKAPHSSSGFYVTLEHKQDGVTFVTEYFHMNSASPLAVGDKVVAGQVIGEVGNTGASSSDPHVHVEIYVKQMTPQATESAPPCHAKGQVAPERGTGRRADRTFLNPQYQLAPNQQSKPPRDPLPE